VLYAPSSLFTKFSAGRQVFASKTANSQTCQSLPVIATQLGAEKNKIDKTEILAENSAFKDRKSGQIETTKK
jgi:hypothetical protein